MVRRARARSRGSVAHDSPIAGGHRPIARVNGVELYRMLPMSGHTTTIEEPGAFNLHVAEFLAAVEHGRWGTWTA